MNDKIAKEIARELRLIRIELQKINKPPDAQKINIDGFSESNVDAMIDEIEKRKRLGRAGERVTIR